MQESKNYVGSGWIKTFENGGEIINLSLDIAKLTALPMDKYGNIKLTVGKLKTVNEKSKATHSVYENTYQPTNNQSNLNSKQSSVEDDELPIIENVNLPF